MFKMMITIRKKLGMSRQDFIQYYETKHIPLVLAVLPPMKEYRRNYVVLEGPVVDAMYGKERRKGFQPDFDVITEVVFDTLEEVHANLAAWANPEIAGKIHADEDNFVQSGGVKFYVVETHSDESQSSVDEKREGTSYPATPAK